MSDGNDKWLLEQHLLDMRAGLPTVISFGVEAIKAAVLINGGAAAATLALAANLSASKPLLAAFLVKALKWFAYGTLTASIATATAYLSQTSYLTRGRAIKFSDGGGFSERPVATVLQNAGHGFRALTAALVACAYYEAFRGFLSVAKALGSLRGMT